MPHHTIAPLPENMVWGYLDAAVPPVLRIASGDTVTLTSWAASNEHRLPPDRSLVQPDHLRAHLDCAIVSIARDVMQRDVDRHR